MNTYYVRMLLDLNTTIKQNELQDISLYALKMLGEIINQIAYDEIQNDP